MLALWQPKTLDFYDFVSLLEKKIPSRRLDHALRAVHKYRNRIRMFRSDRADSVFSRLQELSGADGGLIETELAIQNRPPQVGERISPEREVWALVSSIVFKLNPAFSDLFAKKLIERCLTQQTDLAFSLLHSEGIASLAQNHTGSVNSSLVEIVISSTDDSRSIYALKVARWVPKWAEVGNAALEAMVFAKPPKQTEARWLVNERGNIEETIAFLEESGVTLPTAPEGFPDLRTLTRAVADCMRGKTSAGIEYAIKTNGGKLTPEEFEQLSARIRKTLGDDKPAQ